MKNEIKQHRIDNIMNLDRGRYFDCHSCEDDFEDCK